MGYTRMLEKCVRIFLQFQIHGFERAHKYRRPDKLKRPNALIPTHLLFVGTYLEKTFISLTLHEFTYILISVQALK